MMNRWEEDSLVARIKALKADERLRQGIADARLRAGAVGPMHSLWDAIADAEAVLADKPTLLEYGSRADAVAKLTEALGR